MTGKLPFEGEHQAAIIYSIINEEPQPIARFNNQVSTKLEDMVFKALAKDKEERYQHIDDLLADLRREKKSVEYVKTDVATKRAESPKPAIAVLYLQNLSENKDDAYFAAGMTEDIITQLSKIRGLLITSRSDVEQFKNMPISLREVANRLRVDYIVEGSVRKYGDKIRITCQLIKAIDGFHVWAESYDRQMEDLFAIQADVAKEVAQALKITLAPPELEMIEKKPTQNVQAYDYYLQGREYYWAGADSRDTIKLASEMFENALESDSSFAVAYAGLSDCYCTYVLYALDPQKSWLEEAERAGLKALALDPNLTEAHRSLSRLYWVEGKTDKAIQKAEEGIRANPNNGEALGTLGAWYAWTGQYPKAEAVLNKALEVQPTKTQLFLNFIELYSTWGKKEKVKEYFNRGLEIQPQSFWTYYAMAVHHLFQGELEDAKRLAYKALVISPQSYGPLLTLAQHYIMSSEVDSALYYLNEVIRRYPYWELLVEQGYLELIKGNREQAEIYFDSCIKFNQPLVKEFEGLPDEYYSRSRMALAFALKGQPTEALEQAEKVQIGVKKLALRLEWFRLRGVIKHLSCVYSLIEQKEEAVQTLGYLVKQNIITPAYIKLHPWYKNLAGYPAFEELINRKT